MKDNSAAVHAQVPVEVASFLLNEKRSEIAKIELQQRINVLLVPNKSLETPHYKLERLKHDDPRLDRIEASYKMAEEIEDATTVTRRSQEPTNKQTPVIKGVLPDAPAPIAPVKPEAPIAAAKPARKAAAAPVAAPAATGGFFGWLKNLFGGSASEAAPAAVGKKDEKTREGRNGERRTEGREGGRDGERRDGRRGGRDGRRGERNEGAQGEIRAPREGGRRSEGRSEGRNELREGEARPARGERAERGERSDRPAGDRPPREGRRDGRGENRNEGRSEGRSDAAPELNADGTEMRNERAPRGDGRRERGERGGEGRRERGERGGERRQGDHSATSENNAPEAEVIVAQGQEAQATQEGGAPSENNGERRERRSRDRYGRDRRERAGEPRQDHPNDETPADVNAAPASAAAETNGEDRPAPRSYFERAQQASAAPAAEAPAAVATEAMSAPAVVAEAPVVASPVAPVAVAPVAPAPAPVAPAPAAAPTAAPAAARAGLPSVASYTLQIDNLHQVAQSSGLVWVNSDADKVAAVQAAIAAEPKPVRVPRERPPAVVLDEGPLVLVETRKDLKQLNVPF